MLEKPYATTPEDIILELNTSRNGLSSAEAEKRLEVYGKNVLEEEKTSKAAIFLRQFKSILVYILLAASIVALIVGDMKDFIVVIGILLVNAFLGFWQEVRAEASIAALQKMTESKSKVLRDGKTTEIISSEVVPGDIMILSDGDVVTADLRLFESAGLMINEASITGESIPDSKDHTVVLDDDTPVSGQDNMALSGTTVVRGSGRGVVVRTGNSTFFASIAGKVKEQSPDTPLTRAIQTFSRRYVILILLLLAVVGTADYLYRRSPAETAYIVVAQLVSAVPEGLPLVVTLVMIVGAMALSRKKTLTRYLPAVETLGSATVLASDKTGTITRGKPEVEDFHAGDKDLLFRVSALCNDTEHGLGDPIDVALASWLGDEYGRLRERHPRLRSFPFETGKKYMATVNETERGPELFVKGAFESLKELAGDQDLEQYERAMHSMADRGLRVLAMGTGAYGGEDTKQWDIQMVGVVGFLDPPKEGVRDAVLTAKKAGIRVIMITGDLPQTARYISETVGIWSPGDQVLTGPDIERMDDDSLYAALLDATVLARILPEHKYRVVKALQERRQIVAVTGDGVNDVPALKVADLGIAMGDGTEAAKSVAKMIIVDNDLRVIVDAIRNGRTIANNLRKVIYYLVSTSINQLTLISTTILMGMPLPIFPIQVLWVNLVTDGVQDKTFAFIKEEGDVMTRPPNDINKQFFDTRQVFRILFFGLSMGGIHLYLFNHLLGTYPYESAVSITFTSVVTAQWFNGIQAQKEDEPFFRNIGRSFRINPFIYASVALGLLLQLLVIYVIPGWFNVVPLTAEQWVYVIVSALAGFVLIELRKWGEYFAGTSRQ